MHASRSTLFASILLVVLAAAILSPAEAHTRRRARAPRTPPRPSGSLRVTVFDPADPASVATGYRTVRLLDAFDGKWERRVDSTAVVTFAGVPPGRAIVSWWTPAGDSTFARSDTVWIAVGRTTEAMLELRRTTPSLPASAPRSYAAMGDVTIVVMARTDSGPNRVAPHPLARAFVRLVDAAGTRHESFATDEARVTFTGVAPGRAIRTAWVHGDLPDHGSEPIGTDTILVVPGARVDTMHVVRIPAVGEGLFR